MMGMVVLCEDCVQPRGRVADGSRLKEHTLTGPFVCDRCKRQITPGARASEPAEPVDPFTLTPELALRWQLSSESALSRMRERQGFDPEWRPETYWPSLPADQDLVSRIRGKQRRELLRAALASGDFSGVDPADVREALTVDERRALMKVHPHLTMGEYLPELEDADLVGGEVEIARLYIASGLGNAISIRARTDGRGIGLRAVDEFEQTLSLSPERISKPLSYQELLLLVKSLEFVGPLAEGPLWWLRELEDDPDPEHTAEFISGNSEVYPMFEALIDEDNAAWLEAYHSSVDGDDDLDAIPRA